jgi:hypothetical protein
MTTLWCHSLLGRESVPSDDATIDQPCKLWRLCTKNSSAATNTFMEACGVTCGILAYSISHISNHHVVHTHEGGGDSTASVPRGRAHAIKISDEAECDK